MFPFEELREYRSVAAKLAFRRDHQIILLVKIGNASPHRQFSADSMAQTQKGSVVILWFRL